MLLNTFMIKAKQNQCTTRFYISSVLRKLIKKIEIKESKRIKQAQPPDNKIIKVVKLIP